MAKKKLSDEAVAAQVQAIIREREQMCEIATHMQGLALRIEDTKNTLKALKDEYEDLAVQLSAQAAAPVQLRIEDTAEVA